MSDPWGQHRAATDEAINALGTLQERLSVAVEACDVAMGAILACTGSTDVESAQTAMRMVAGAKDHLDEIFRATQTAVEEMERYGRGF
jgi:hypothetical protein